MSLGSDLSSRAAIFSLSFVYYTHWLGLQVAFAVAYATASAQQLMLSPSRGFCCYLPVRLGALVVSFLCFLGSGILAGITLRSLATISAHITSIQTAGFYLTSLSWASLALFSLLGFISVIFQHPLILTIFTRFVCYHIPGSLFCNLFLTTVLFHSYRGTDSVLRSPQCAQTVPTTSICHAFAALETLSWVYLFIMLPACIFQIYVYVVMRRFIFVVSGEWTLWQEEILERQRRSMGMAGRQRRATITQTIGRGVRRRAKALWFTMETPESRGTVATDSFLPSMILSPSGPMSSPRSPFSMSSTAGLLSPFRSTMLDKKMSRSSLSPVPTSPLKGKEVVNERSANLDMDFSDPDPMTRSPQSGECMISQGVGEGEESQSDPIMRSGEGSSSGAKI